MTKHRAFGCSAVGQAHADSVVSDRAGRRDDEILGKNDARDRAMMTVDLND